MVQDNSAVQQPRKKLNICTVLGAVGIVLILAMGFGVSISAHYQSLKASVRYDGTQFVFQNDDDFDWTGVQFLLNTDYKYTLPLAAAHSSFAVQAVEFAKDDGTKFDPNSMSPYDFILTAKVPHAQWSSWFYKFN
jgi:hypothetical protein